MMMLRTDIVEFSLILITTLSTYSTVRWIDRNKNIILLKILLRLGQ